jgi:hypothetical protein
MGKLAVCGFGACSTQHRPGVIKGLWRVPGPFNFRQSLSPHQFAQHVVSSSQIVPKSAEPADIPDLTCERHQSEHTANSSKGRRSGSSRRRPSSPLATRGHFKELPQSDLFAWLVITLFTVRAGALGCHSLSYNTVGRPQKGRLPPYVSVHLLRLRVS